MNLRLPAALWFAWVLLGLFASQPQSAAQAEQAAAPPPDFKQLLAKMGQFSADPCGPSSGDENNWHSDDVELRLFSKADDVVKEALNASPATPSSPEKRAAVALKDLEQMSAKVNAAWPAENRFHFAILDLPPALVVKMSMRAHETFSVFAVVEEDSGKPTHAWRAVGSEEASNEHEAAATIQLSLYPLHRGPSRNARFLAKFIYSGCAGSLGVAYDAREWNPKSIAVDQVIQQEGSLGLDDKVTDFEQIGKLQTEGPLITLPYCWFSAIDTWDNPSLCAVDTYDVEGDEVRFRSRTYNRPDLVPVAKAIEYAAKRDYPAVLGYCASEDIARALVRQLPPDTMGTEDLEVTRLSPGKERVTLGDPPAYEFEIEKRADRWVVTSFSAE